MNKFLGLIITIFDFIFGIIIIGLLFRFILRMFAANPNADFVQLIYNNTQAFVSPFQGIFGNLRFGSNGIIEVHTLIAMVVYIIAAILLTEIFLNLNRGLSDGPEKK